MVSLQLPFLIAANLCFLLNTYIKSKVPQRTLQKGQPKAQTALYRQLCGGEISTEQRSNAPGLHNQSEAKVQEVQVHVAG